VRIRKLVMHARQSEAARRSFREDRQELRQSLARLGATLIRSTGRERASTDLL